MRSTFFALGLLAVAAIHPAQAQQAKPGTTPGSEPPAAAAQDGADQNPMLWPMRRGPDRFRSEGSGHDRFGPQHMGPPPEFMLAARLSLLEMQIGVRAEQLDAWRGYTSALQAVLTPPRPDHGPGGPGTNAANLAPQGDPTVPDPFGLQEQLADDVTLRAVEAGKLADAIAALRDTLTPEQLEILSSAHGEPSGP
ncbi:hypothetical protein [Mesorhizobium qingshengii]|uniref:LTXXQ motif family protein n=1 Tax=Mesorhizobium qingshengii TaxID=1165689 RepID=A0A1G5ZV22_9HYPH|nr:hypothetical protein [Mesorhizobium qingshengii]SDA98143.1 hypothetical protein SAMN02927914_06089 [Mesorhizobium qingshengii]